MLSHNWQHLSLYHSTWQFYYTLIFFFFFWFWQLMCDLINNHADGGENWTAMCCYVEKSETITKGKATQSVFQKRSENTHPGACSTLYFLFSLERNEARRHFFPPLCAGGLKWSRPPAVSQVSSLRAAMFVVCLCLHTLTQRAFMVMSALCVFLSVCCHPDRQTFDPLVQILFTHQF